MVERRLAKANVASSNLVSRSIVETRHHCKKTGSHLSFCLSVGFSSFPKSSAILFGSVADELLFVFFIFLFLLYYLPFIFTKEMTAPSLPRETSLHRNRDASLRYSVASLLTYLVSRSIVATKRLSQETIFFRLSLCFFACCSSFPKSSAFLRERSGRSAFRDFFYSINNSCQR